MEGDFYRILSPFEGNDTSWMVVSRDKKQAVAGYYERLNKVNASWMRLRFKGLDEDQLYRVEWEDKCLKAYGNELMYAGIPVDRDYCNKTNGDFHSVLYTIEAEVDRIGCRTVSWYRQTAGYGGLLLSCRLSEQSCGLRISV